MADGEFDNLTVNNVLTIGADTNLYRSAANVLKTDDYFTCSTLTVVGDAVIQRSGGSPCYIQTPASDVRIFADSNVPLILGANGLLYLKIDTDGKLDIGNAGDTHLYREGANILRTDDTLRVPYAVNAIRGVMVGNPADLGGNDFGLAVAAPTGANPSWPFGVCINGQRHFAITSSGQVVLHDDVVLYRSAANVLATNDDFRLEVGSADHRGLALQRSGIDSRIFFTETYKAHGFSLIYASDDNPTFDGTSFTLPQNSLYFIRHDNSETGQVVMQIPRTLSQVWLPAQGSSGGIVLGGDANLYRSDLNVLKTDDTFEALSLKIGGTEVINSSRQITAMPPLYLNFANSGQNTAEILMGKAGSPAADKIRWDFSVRSNNKDFWLYGYNGTSYYNFMKCSWDTKKVEFQSEGLAIGDTNLYRSAENTLSLAGGDKMTFSDLVKIYTPMPFLEVDPANPVEENEVKDMCFDNDFNEPDVYEGVTGILKFQDTGETNHFTSLFGIVIDVEGGPQSPALCTTHHLVVRKDFMAGGVLKSYEGAVVLHGGYAGWAPSNNPFIFLAEGGDYGNKETLEIRIVENEEWDYGDLACRTITTAGHIIVGDVAMGGIMGPLYRNLNNEISYAVSAMRYKENVETAEDASWIYNFRPVNFDWKDQNRAKKEGRQLGLIAEEVNALRPQLTWLDSEGRPEGVHYEWLGVPLLVEVKKLHKRVEALENKLKQNPTAA